MTAIDHRFDFRSRGKPLVLKEIGDFEFIGSYLIDVATRVTS